MLPAFALVIIMALGFVVDGASSFMAQRALVSQVSAIASDAAELAMDSGYFYRTGEHRIDGAVATAEVRRRVAELHPANVENIDLRGVRIDGTSVVIDLEADARLIFARDAVSGQYDPHFCECSVDGGTRRRRIAHLSVAQMVGIQTNAYFCSWFA